MDEFPAHIRTNPDKGEERQTVAQHCQHVAQYTKEALEPVGLSSLGQLAGLLHDTGKFCLAFSNYITRASRGEAVRRGSVNHTFAGVRLLFERYYRCGGPPYRNMTCELLSAVVGSHHGLFDCIGPNGEDGFKHRLEATGVAYAESKHNFLHLCADEAKLDALFEQSVAEITQITAACKWEHITLEELHFCFSMVYRLVLSALIDADRRDTAEFMHEFLRVKPQSDPSPIWGRCLHTVEARLDKLPTQTAVQRARHIISKQCGDFPADSHGIYRLSVPTGSGKTLTSLRFALSTAYRHHKSRILFVIPLLSVLEQNAEVIKDYLGDASLVLEHHSNVVHTQVQPEALDEHELLAETWQSPVVITTLVQLLNTLFDGSPTCVRRMHALTDSVLIIDEVQSLPRHMISQFNLALNFLTQVCHATVVLCSATQPCLEEAAHPMQYAPAADLVPYDRALWQPFQRTELIDRRTQGGYAPEALAAFAAEQLKRAGSLLLICNKKDQARTLYELLHHANAAVFHLSTAMCMEHRIQTLRAVADCLEKKPVICVATQMVECGVDLSFGCVIRILAGMDNVVQAAGRCNRNGESGAICPVYIVNWQGEDLSHLKEIRQAQQAAVELLYSFEQDHAAFGHALASNEAIHYYYRRLFANMHGQAQDYPIEKKHTTLLQLLGNNAVFWGKSPQPPPHTFRQAFRTAGELFQVFDDRTTDVLVPYGIGTEVITALGSARAEWDLPYCKKLLEQAKPYTIALFEYQVNALKVQNGLYALCGGTVLALRTEFYQNQTGVQTTPGAQLFMEV